MSNKSKTAFLFSLFLSFAVFLTSLTAGCKIVQAQAAEDLMANLFPNAIYKQFTEEHVTRGIVHTKFEVFDKEGWLKGSILTVDLKDSNVGVELLYPGKIAATATPEKMAKNAGAIAVVNGDFFDIGKTNAPIGVAIKDGKLLKSARLRGQSIGISTDGIGSIFHFILSGIVTNTSSPGTPRLVLGGINEYSIIPNQLFMYTPDWGSRSRASLVQGHSLYAEVVVKDNVVVEVLENSLYTKPLEDNMYLLLGLAGAAKVVLEGYKPGDIIDISMTPSVDPQQFKLALGGDVHLVINGKAQTFPTNPYRHPRTGMGFSQDGKTLYLAVVDGRQKDSRGMSYDEMAQFMASIGAWNAINLDSGGSTQMLTRPLGETEIKLANSPSDGKQRYIPNAVGLFTNAPAGRLMGFKIESLSNRIFTGLTRTFTTTAAYDEYYNPISIEGPFQWTTDEPSLGFFEKDGLLRGDQKGSGEVIATVSGVSSSYPIKVLGKPAEIFTDVKELYLPKNNSKTFKVYGLSSDGYHALIESRDIKLMYDNSLLEVTPLSDHSFKVTSKMDSGTALIEVQAGEWKTWVGVASGYETVPVTGFDNHGEWSFDKYPEEVIGKVSPVSDRVVNGLALRLDYNFTKTTATRAAYMVPTAGPLPLPDGTQKLGLQVYGTDGKKHWLRGVVIDSAGNRYTIDFAKEVNWEGWKYVEAAIPSAVKYPIQLERIYLVSIDPNNLTAGSIVIDELVAKIPTKASLPDDQINGIILKEPNSSFNDGLKFAVVSGIEINSLNPYTENKKAVKEALDKAKKFGINLAFAAGNTVAQDTKNNYAAARQFLDESLMSIPYYVIPGSKDIKGTGSLNNFKQTFGESFKVIDSRGTRFLLLNMATGSWRSSNAGQWNQILNALEEAASLPSIKNVVVINSLPIPNGVTLKTVSGITDAKEAELLRKILADFREKSNKPVAFISGQDEFRVDRFDGITYIGVGKECPVFSINPDAEQWIQIIKVK